MKASRIYTNRKARRAGCLAVILLLMMARADAADKHIAIIVFDGVLTSDVTAPVEVFGAASKKAWFSDYRVSLVAATLDKEIETEEGLNIRADKTIYDTGAYDVIIAPSAYSMKPWLSNKDLIGFIRDQRSQASWMASNCSGAMLLAEAGVLDYKRATTWFGGERSLARKYPKVKVVYNENVVIDEGVITSNGGVVSYQSALALLAKLASEDFAKEIAASTQFSRLNQVSEK